jgi:hypothetical protein
MLGAANGAAPARVKAMRRVKGPLLGVMKILLGTGRVCGAFEERGWWTGAGIFAKHDNAPTTVHPRLASARGPREGPPVFFGLRGRPCPKRSTSS